MAIKMHLVQASTISIVQATPTAQPLLFIHPSMCQALT